MYEYVGIPSPGSSHLEIHYHRDSNEAHVLYGAAFHAEYAIFAEILTFTTFVVRQLVNLSDPRDAMHYEMITKMLLSGDALTGHERDALSRIVELKTPPEKSRRSFIAHMTFGYGKLPRRYVPLGSRLLSMPSYRVNEFSVSASSLELKLNGFGIMQRKAPQFVAPAVQHLLLYFEKRHIDDAVYLDALHGAAKQCASLDLKRVSASVNERGNIVASPEVFDQQFIASDIAMNSCYGVGVGAINGVLST